MRYRMFGRRTLVLCLLTVANAPALGAQAVLSGVVKEDSSGRLLPGVEVRLEGTDRVARTDSAGRYALVSKKGEHVALFRALGYQPSRVRVKLADGDTARADAALVRVPAHELDTVAVNAAPVVRTMREGIVERKRLGLGKFIEAAELRKYDARNTGDFLRSLGVRLIEYYDCEPFRCPVELRAVGDGARTEGGAKCYSTVVFDNVVIYRSGTTMRPPDFRRDFPSTSLAAIEYYKNATQIPTEFAGWRADCGVIVLWSRRD